MSPIDGTWRNPAIRRCYGKIASPDWHRAEVRAQRASARTGDLIIAYECYDCGKFHIGHADKTQKLVRQSRVDSTNTHCPRCGELVSTDRRYEAAESGALVVYCSPKCRQKSGKKRERAMRLAQDPPPA